MILNVDTAILVGGLAALGVFAAFRWRAGSRVDAPDLPVARFEGTRLAKDGVVAVLFHPEWCPYSRMFRADFARWDAPDGVQPMIADITPRSSPLWDDFDIHTTPTMALFEDGALVQRWDGVRGLGLTRRELEEMDAAARRLVGA